MDTRAISRDGVVSRVPDMSFSEVVALSLHKIGGLLAASVIIVWRTRMAEPH